MTFRMIRQLSTILLVVGAIGAPAAQAGHQDLGVRSAALALDRSDAVDRYLANDSAQARQPTPTPDLIERWVASGRGQADLIERWVASRRGQTDVIERSVEIRRPVGLPDGRPDGYQPQVRGTGTEAVAVSRTSADGFAWGDAGIGAAFGLALALIAGGTLVAARGRLAHS
jgi:hypothetical protein